MIVVEGRTDMWLKMTHEHFLDFKHTDEWKNHGYDGTSDLALRTFGYTVTRDQRSDVVFTFDNPHDYTLYLLRHS